LSSDIVALSAIPIYACNLIPVSLADAFALSKLSANFFSSSLACLVPLIKLAILGPNATIID